MNLDYILDLPLDITLLILRFYKEEIDKENKIISQFHNIPKNNM